MVKFKVLVTDAAGSTPIACGNGIHDPSANSRYDGRTSGAVAAARTSSPPLQPQEPPAHKHANPDRVMRSFNTWAFKRGQPDDPRLMLGFVTEAVSVEAPVSFVLYWGKGPRCRIGQPDIECLDYLAEFARRLGEAYEPGAAIKLIFTDTHAELNGHSPETIRSYFDDVGDAARQRGFDNCWLGAITRAAGAAAIAVSTDVASQETLRQLSASAKKWFRGEGTCEEGALKYLEMNLIERRAVELAFPRSIFITFSGSKLRGLLPERLPIFYMYSLRRGVGIKPWFLPVDAVPCGDSLCRCAGA
jgi:L-tyrosine isonitrile synthase